MTDDELAEKACRVISDMCKGDRWRMCIPVQPDDSDVILGTLVRRFNELRATLLTKGITMANGIDLRAPTTETPDHG